LCCYHWYCCCWWCCCCACYSSCPLFYYDDDDVQQTPSTSRPWSQQSSLWFDRTTWLPIWRAPNLQGVKFMIVRQDYGWEECYSAANEMTLKSYFNNIAIAEYLVCKLMLNNLFLANPCRVYNWQVSVNNLRAPRNI